MSNVSFKKWSKIVNTEKDVSVPVRFETEDGTVEVSVTRTIPAILRAELSRKAAELCAPVDDDFDYDDTTPECVVNAHRTVNWNLFDMLFKMCVIGAYTDLEMDGSDEQMAVLSVLVGQKWVYDRITAEIQDDLWDVEYDTRELLKHIDDKQGLLAQRLMLFIDKVKAVVPTESLEQLLDEIKDSGLTAGDLVKLFPDGDEENDK